LRLSRLKARAVAQKHPGCVVIGSDQVLDLEGKCVGKPGNRENCIKQLEEMAGKTLIFHTAMTVIDASGLGHSAVVDTTIKMKELKRETIEAYVDLEKPFNCAGSAKLEKLGICLISSFQSDDPTAIIGLGLIELTSMLEKCGIEVLPGLK
uniref:Maf family protein n=1 Tax=Turicimonas muris TaxID=1796652 RepID=UPI00402AA27A